MTKTEIDRLKNVLIKNDNKTFHPDLSSTSAIHHLLFKEELCKKYFNETDPEIKKKMTNMMNNYGSLVRCCIIGESPSDLALTLERVKKFYNDAEAIRLELNKLLPPVKQIPQVFNEFTAIDITLNGTDCENAEGYFNVYYGEFLRGERNSFIAESSYNSAVDQCRSDTRSVNYFGDYSGTKLPINTIFVKEFNDYFRRNYHVLLAEFEKSHSKNMAVILEQMSSQIAILRVALMPAIDILKEHILSELTSKNYDKDKLANSIEAYLMFLPSNLDEDSKYVDIIDLFYLEFQRKLLDCYI